MSKPVCPLCFSRDVKYYWHDKRREYENCERCHLVFVPEHCHLPLEQEKAEYDKHENSVGDMGYRRFLGRIVVPVLSLLQAGAVGLDFGCGPGPALPSMFAEKGLKVYAYDLFYAPDQKLLGRQYDFVMATEVIEHLRAPYHTLQQMWACVKPGGLLGIMSKLVIDQPSFTRWHYKNDPTHICFFSRQSLAVVAAQWGASLEFVENDAFIFYKPSV